MHLVLACMTLGISKTWFVCMTLGIGLESSREIKGFGGIFLGIYIILVGLARRYSSSLLFKKNSVFFFSILVPQNQQVCSSSE